MYVCVHVGRCDGRLYSRIPGSVYQLPASTMTQGYDTHLQALSNNNLYGGIWLWY